MNKIYNFYFQTKNNEFRCYTPRFNEYKTINNSELHELQNRYEIFYGYDATDLGALNYYNDFMIWNKELFESGLDAFTFSYSNKLAVMRCFKKYLNKNIYDYRIFEKDGIRENIIGEIESFYFENCNNGCLIYCENGTYKECYGYDYKSFYPWALGKSDFKIPLKEGRLVKLKRLDKNKIKYGFYNVLIQSDDPRFLKIFKYSKKNIYTHYSLLFAYKHQQEFNIKIELLKDYDAYLYHSKDLCKSVDIFGNWYDKLIEVKNKYPKNKLIKHLLSGLWGVLSEFKKIYIKKEDTEKYDVGMKNDDCEYFICEDSNNQNNSYQTLMKKTDMYKSDLRIKPFLLSFSRNVMGDIAFNNHFDEIVRIYCDNIVYKSNVPFNVDNMIQEDKTSGFNITWKNNRQVFKT